MENRITKDIVVLYHGPGCMDGFGAAWSAWLKLGDTADYVPAQHGKPMPRGLEKAKTVYVLDFCWPKAPMEWLSRKVPNLVVLDHHHGAAEVLEGKPWAVFDVSKSGAILAWEHFHPGKTIPMGLVYICDRDLWTWKVEGSRAFCRKLAGERKDFTHWSRLMSMEGAELEAYLAEGELLDDYHMAIIRRIAARAKTFALDGYTGLAVNAPSMFASEVGHVLAERSGTFGAVWQLAGPDSVDVNLRAAGEVDVSIIAKRHGGGGLRSAAGMCLPLDSLATLL